jgi:hypothetical protein
MLGELRALRFFPNDELVMNAVVRLCGSMCASEEQVRWLVDRMTSGIYTEWPGIAEMRACFCCRYKPKDGVNAYSTVFPDGLPPDPTAPPRPGIAAPDLKRLPPGHEVTADPELEASIQRLADKGRMRPTHNTKSLAEEERALEAAPRRYLTDAEKQRRLAELEAALGKGGNE